MPELIEMLEISPGKVAHVILRSREVDVKTEAWDEETDSEIRFGWRGRRNDPGRFARRCDAARA